MCESGLQPGLWAIILEMTLAVAKKLYAFGHTFIARTDI